MSGQDWAELFLDEGDVRVPDHMVHVAELLLVRHPVCRDSIWHLIARSQHAKLAEKCGETKLPPISRTLPISCVAEQEIQRNAIWKRFRASEGYGKWASATLEAKLLRLVSFHIFLCYLLKAETIIYYVVREYHHFSQIGGKSSRRKYSLHCFVAPNDRENYRLGHGCAKRMDRAVWKYGKLILYKTGNYFDRRVIF